MRSIALLPAAALLAGTYAGIACGSVPSFALPSLGGLTVVAAAAWHRASTTLTVAATVMGFAVAGFVLGAAEARRALHPPLRSVLHEKFGGFSIDSHGPPGPHEPVLARMRLEDDAVPGPLGIVKRAAVVGVHLDGEWRAVTGGIRLSVSGGAAGRSAPAWRAGRTIEAPVTFRRPQRYLNDGVPDFERSQAFEGVALGASVKSALLIDVIAVGSGWQERAAAVRAHVRSVMDRRVRPHDAVAAAIVTAILIGDRTALPADVRERLQAAGTYHVIAISGGNIAILAAAMAGLLMAAGLRGRRAAFFVIAGLAAYAAVVNAGPSVWRATTMAVVYLSARLLDLRSPPWNALAASAGLMACLSPLDAMNVGFMLTFGASAAILEAARRVSGTWQGAARWVLAGVAASFATELVLAPVSAAAFSRVTLAGLVLNLAAVPLMTVTQVSGLVAVGLDRFDSIANLAGLVAAVGARALVQSAALVDVLPWLAMRVPPPSPLLVLVYYAALAAALWWRRYSRPAGVVIAICAVAMVTGAAAATSPATGQLRLTMFDVGQGEALLVETPDGRRILVDAGGAGTDGTGFDIGGRVLAPALWAHGILRLDALAITHADPDHIGGGPAVVRDFRPAELWQGIPVSGHAPSEALQRTAVAARAATRVRLAGWQIGAAGAIVRVLHPPAAEWERPRVRNDDSLVVEVRYGDVAVLLTGDAGAEVEREILPSLPHASIRVLKVGHHGSRTSTSQALLDAWRPHVALISCGRGNRFGHPAPEVLRRLETAGTRIYRTDRHGQITLDTDGKALHVTTFVPIP